MNDQKPLAPSGRTPGNVIPLRRPSPASAPSPMAEDEWAWHRMINEELAALRNEVAMTNSLLRRLVKVLRENAP